MRSGIKTTDSDKFIRMNIILEMNLFRSSMFILFPMLVFFLSCTEISDTKNSKMQEIEDFSDSTIHSELSRCDKCSPLLKLRHYLTSNGFVTDTARLKSLADYAYPDLRKTSFIIDNGVLKNLLDNEKHSMGKSKILIKGEGYFFAKIDFNGRYTGIDLGFEYWKIDTTKTKELNKLKFTWKEKYHPMPLSIAVKGNNLYVLYARSVGFSTFLDSCLNQIEGNL